MSWVLWFERQTEVQRLLRRGAASHHFLSVFKERKERGVLQQAVSSNFLSAPESLIFLPRLHF